MKIIVRAAKGRIVHFPQRVKAGPGASTLCISGDTTVEIEGSHRFIRRRLRVGDLVLVKTATAKRETTTEAATRAKKD